MVQISLLYVRSRTEVSGLLWTSTYPKVAEFSNQIQEKSDLKIFLGPFFYISNLKTLLKTGIKEQPKKTSLVHGAYKGSKNLPKTT